MSKVEAEKLKLVERKCRLKEKLFKFNKLFSGAELTENLLLHISYS